MITLLVRLKAQPGKVGELAEVCAQLAKVVQAQEEGCLMYLPHVSSEDPSEIVFFEKYKDDEANAAHTKSAHFKAGIKKIMALLAAPIQVEKLSEL